MSALPPDQLPKLRRILAALDAAEHPTDLDLPGYALHPLKGDLRGVWAVKVTGNWRVTSRLERGEACDVDLVDYH